SLFKLSIIYFQCSKFYFYQRKSSPVSRTEELICSCIPFIPGVFLNYENNNCLKLFFNNNFFFIT
ncbi:hypothetical protein L9F63_016590, partial [Diploptera punctata]